MNKMKRKSIGLYVSVSTLAQDIDGFSINAQITQLKEYCSFQGYKVVDVYADRGISGKSMNRPELQRMLKDSKEGKLDCVMVYKTSRLARNTSDLLSIVEGLHR
ncbi:recombinase RecB, partial [Mammaliicoccus vitulinus]|uniref:recombinase family protein n=1 Tax=Mammaliicoccus vitulinus TaxID=71237 RepID=UPI000D4D09AD